MNSNNQYEGTGNEMIKTRLVRLLSHAKKYIVYNVMWQWMALIAQVVSVFTIAGLFGKLYAKKAASGDIVKCACVFAAVLVVRFLPIPNRCSCFWNVQPSTDAVPFFGNRPARDIHLLAF